MKDEPAEDQTIINLKTPSEIEQLFQDGFTVYDGKTLKKLIDFSKKGFDDLHMKVSTRSHSDFSIHSVSLHDQLPNLMAVVFNDNKSRCELYNLECEHKQESKLRRLNSMLFYDDSALLDSLLLSPTKNDFLCASFNRNQRVKHKTDAIKFMVKPQTKLKNGNNYESANLQPQNEFEFFGSITPRPVSNSYKYMQEGLQDFSIFH